MKNIDLQIRINEMLISNSNKSIKSCISISKMYDDISKKYSELIDRGNKILNHSHLK